LIKYPKQFQQKVGNNPDTEPEGINDPMCQIHENF